MNIIRQSNELMMQNHDRVTMYSQSNDFLTPIYFD